MYQHHKDSLENMVNYFQRKEGIIAMIFGGSVAKGTEKPTSDLDAVLVVTQKEYERRKKENCLSETIEGYCTYEGGYFDVKYKTKEYLKLAAEFGSEPTRSSFYKARVMFSSDPEIAELLQKINTFPVCEKERKCKVFWANICLNQNYFMWCLPENGNYMRLRTVSEIVYSVYRLILEENEVLFPCNRRLEEYVEQCKKKPEHILELAEEFMQKMDTESCKKFVDAWKNFTSLPVTEDNSEILSTYVRAYEEWWSEEHAAFVNEW